MSDSGIWTDRVRSFFGSEPPKTIISPTRGCNSDSSFYKWTIGSGKGPTLYTRYEDDGRFELLRTLVTKELATQEHTCRPGNASGHVPTYSRHEETGSSWCTQCRVSPDLIRNVNDIPKECIIWKLETMGDGLEDATELSRSSAQADDEH